MNETLDQQFKSHFFMINTSWHSTSDFLSLVSNLTSLYQNVIKQLRSFSDKYLRQKIVSFIYSYLSNL